MWMLKQWSRQVRCLTRALQKMVLMLSVRMRCRALDCCVPPCIESGKDAQCNASLSSKHVSMVWRQSAQHRCLVPNEIIDKRYSCCSVCLHAIEGSSNCLGCSASGILRAPPLHGCSLIVHVGVSHWNCPLSVQDMPEVETAQPPASMSLTEQRQLAQSIRQQMGLPPDEDDEAMKVPTCLFSPLIFSAYHALLCSHTETHAHANPHAVYL